MIISGNDLLKLVEDNVITNVTDDLINAGSIDITCGINALIEAPSNHNSNAHLLQKDNYLYKVKLPYTLAPNECILLESEQFFNLPTSYGIEGFYAEPIFAEYKLKSTMARNFVDAFNAGWCDAGWHGAKLTIELRNCNRYRNIVINPGDRIGQMIFYLGTSEIPNHLSYATKGRYNNTTIVTGAK